MKLKIAVNTTATHSHRSIPLILNSLNRIGFNNDDIFIIEGGHNERTVDYLNSTTYIKTNHNSIDYNGLVEIVEQELEAEYWFYIHDTVIAGEKLKDLLFNKLDTNFKKMALYSVSSGSMNMGVYSYQYLLKHKNYILSKKNTDYTRFGILEAKRLATMDEDFLLWKLADEPCKAFSDTRQEPTPKDKLNFLTDTLKIDLSPITVRLPIERDIICYRPYGLDFAPRIIEYYEGLDLYKFKSNFGWNNPTGDREKYIINL